MLLAAGDARAPLGRKVADQLEVHAVLSVIQAKLASIVVAAGEQLEQRGGLRVSGSGICVRVCVCVRGTRLAIAGECHGVSEASTQADDTMAGEGPDAAETKTVRLRGQGGRKQAIADSQSVGVRTGRLVADMATMPTSVSARPIRNGKATSKQGQRGGTGAGS
jgi:hypothetical protein